MEQFFPKNLFPRVVSGLAQADDAAVYALNETTSLIFTTDFFTPVVDDPYVYGAIAAANALSDIYAMGGKPILALNIACFPKNMDEKIIKDVFTGAAAKVSEAGAAIAGGHTIDDEEPKFGLAVIGLAHPDSIFEKSGAVPGDAVILTKKLGSGIITTALKANLALDEEILAATESMSALNKFFSEVAHEASCHAATDVTGFGFIGHALEIARNSHVKLKICLDLLPFLPGVIAHAESWLFPAGTGRNSDAFNNKTRFDHAITEEFRQLLFTPETSGGLLLCVPENGINTFFQKAREQNAKAWQIGYVCEGSGIEITL